MSILPKNLEERLRRFHYNYISLMRLIKLIRLTKRGKSLPCPRFIYVEPTNICNYQCPKCPQSEGLKREPTTMSIELFGEFIRQIKPYRPRITLHHSGEPFLNPHLFDMIKLARESGIVTAVFTNVSLLDKDDFRIVKEGPDAITFSVDSADAQSYSRLHGGAQWEKVKRNIEEFFRRLTSASPVKYVQLLAVINDQSPEEITTLREFISNFPFNSVVIKNAFAWPRGGANTELSFPKNYMVFPCAHPWLSSAVLADGSVAPCCLDAHGLYRVGNIAEQGFMELFNGEKMNELRWHLLHPQETSPIPLCDSCCLKNLGYPMTWKRKLAFYTMPAWRLLLKNPPTPVEALEIQETS